MEQSRTIIKQQQEMYELFGHKDAIIWDSYAGEKDALKRKIDLIISTDTEPASLSATEKKARDKFVELKRRLVDVIWEQRKYNNGTLQMSPVFVACCPDIYLDRNITKCSINFTLHPLFRIIKCLKDDDSSNCCMIFVDENGRVYQNWHKFKSDNQLPKGVLVAPRLGIYNCDTNGNVRLETFDSPALSVTSAITRMADVGSSVVSFAASGIAISALFLPVAGATLVGAAALGIGSATYATGRSVYYLFDRSKHEQSVSIDNAEARCHWLGAAGGIVSLAAGASTKGIAYFASSGKDVSKVIMSSVTALNASSILFNGMGVANGFFTIYIKKKDCEEIGTLEIVQLGASLFLFTHSIYNYQTAERIVNDSQNKTIGKFKELLSKNQQKAFNKMFKETLRIKGGDVGKRDVIRSLRNIPDAKGFFRDVYKMNKNLNQHNVRPSFSPDGTMLLNNDAKTVPSTLRSDLRQLPPSTVFADVTPIPDTHPNGNGNLASNVNNAVISESRISQGLFVLKATQKVLSSNNVRDQLINIAENLTHAAFDKFMDIIEGFVQQFSPRIEQLLKRFIPMEDYMQTIYSIIYSLAVESNEEISNFILKLDRNVIHEIIRDFYASLKPSENVAKRKCTECGGTYSCA